MRVIGVSWLGVKTADPGRMLAFLRDVMGLPLVVGTPSFAVFVLPGGDKVEVFGPDGPDPAYQFERNGVVAGFLVDDIDDASRELLDGGAELLGPRHVADDGYAWQHFRAPDGRVYSLAFDPRHAAMDAGEASEP